MSRSGILVIDKPEGLTSQGVVSRVRRALGMKRVGHGGTLDPMATGVLPVFVGRATRASGMLLDADKSYRAGFVTGIRTDTQDTTGEIIERSDKQADPDDVRTVLQQFVGKQQQTPPMYSAIKVDGKKLYELARKGVEIERKSREIEIFSLKYLGFENNVHTIDVHCSKGTYIRTLIDDIGGALGCGAAMCALRRTKTGRFSLDDAVLLDNLNENTPLLPVDSLWSDLPALTVSAEAETRVRVGASVRVNAPDGDCRVYAPSGDFLMLGRVDGGTLVTVKNFFEVD